MINFYLIITILCGIVLVFDLFLSYTEKIKSFHVEFKHKYKGKTIPIEKLIPQNLTMLFVLLFVTGIIGMILELLKLMWFISLPCSVFSGFIACFIYQYPVQLAIKKIKKLEMPRGTLASGIEGYLIEPIFGDDYGIIRFTWQEEEYDAPAFSVNETDLPEYERVIIILEENGCYCVEGITEVYDYIDDDNL